MKTLILGGVTTAVLMGGVMPHNADETNKCIISECSKDIEEQYMVLDDGLT